MPYRILTLASRLLACCLPGLLASHLAWADDLASQQLRDQQQTQRQLEQQQRLERWQRVPSPQGNDENHPIKAVDSHCWAVTGVRLAGHRQVPSPALEATVLPFIQPCMTLTAADALKVEGSTLHANSEMQLKARQIEVGTTALQESGTQRNYRGDLVSGTFFGDRKGNDTQGQVVAGSRVTADGKLSVVADQVTIKGSKVYGKQDSVLYSKKGLLAIETDHGSSTSTDHLSDSKLFGLIGSDRKRTTRKDQVLFSDVSSSSNLRLASADELRILGAKVEAGKHLQVEAKGDVVIDSAQSRNETDTQHQQRGLSVGAKQTEEAQDGKPDSRQYEASLGYQVATTTGKTHETSQVSSELKGASVGLQSDAHLQVNGSKVQASAGDLNVNAKHISLGATRNERESVSKNNQSGGSVKVTGGIDRLGSAFAGHHNTHTELERGSTVQRSELKASAGVKLEAEHLLTEAARVGAGQQLKVSAKHIENRAVQETHERESVTDNWAGSLGASVEYRDLTRPIERLVLGEEAARFQQASPEDAMVAPSVGADMTVDHLKRLENQRRGFALVSELSGAGVEVKAEVIDDQGTAWKANAGKLLIDASLHNLRATENTQVDTVERMAYGGDARLDTSSGSDLNVRIAGKGGSLGKQDTASTAVPGSLYGQQGIQVQLGSDGQYEGSRIDGGEGNVVLRSAGTLSLDLSHQQRDTVARQTTLKGSEGVELKVAGDARLVGARLQSAKGDVELSANAVTHETLSGSDYRRDVSIDVSNSPVDLGTAVAEFTKGKGAADGVNALDLGVLRTSGHNRSAQWVSNTQGKAD